MPRLIFKCPYIKSGTSAATAHLENYVKYMATRSGVERIDPGCSEWPATLKQKKMVEQILQDFPLSRGMFEYEDYEAAPTRANASEFITRALEDNYDQIAKKDNYLKYIATRPRAQRVGSHGLFTGEEDQLVLTQVAEAVAAHPGNVWLPIISLRREDAARLGYDKAEEWKALLTQYAMEMAAAMKIPWEDFRWYAAFHDAAHHPHVHMVCYSADPPKGFLTTQGITQIKSGLAKQIFRQELTELYQKQTQSRDALNEDARSVMEQLIEQMQSGTADGSRMEELMEHLAERLRHTGGRKQYGYLKAPLKAVVNEIVDELAKDPRVAAAYALWYELREDVLRTYKDDLPQRLPLSQQKEFKRIKNIVIEEAVKLGARQQIFHPDDQQDRVPVEDQEEAPLPEAPQPDIDWNDSVESPPEGIPNKTVSAPAKAQMNWSDEYRLARRCLFGGKDQPQDFATAPDNSDNTDGNDIPAEGLTFPNPVEAPETITTVGPDGSPAAWYTELELTPEELAQVRSMNLTACFELINASEWDNANLIGFQDACEAMNIKIVGQGCCDLDPIQQKTNMESFAALNPDIVTCQPQDLDVCAPTFDPLWQAGVKLTFMSNVPTGYTAGKEYVGAITDSIVDMGIDSAEMMADAIGGEGEILAITVADVNYVCNTRDDAFLKTIAEQYPNITVAEVGGFSSPNEAAQITSALLTKYPNVKGIFVSYSTPCIDVLQTVKALGRTDIKIVTMDLDTTCALDMAQGGNIVGIACDMPYAMGYGRALMAAYACIGKECPGYVTSPSFKVTRENLLEGYRTSLGIEAPADVQAALNG